MGSADAPLQDDSQYKHSQQLHQREREVLAAGTIEKWTQVNLIKFNEVECEVLCLNRGSPCSVPSKHCRYLQRTEKNIYKCVRVAWRIHTD